MAFEDIIDITPQQLQTQIMEYLEEAIKRAEVEHKDTLKSNPHINLYRFAHFIMHDTLKEGMKFDQFMEYYIDDHGYYIWNEDKSQGGK